MPILLADFAYDSKTGDMWIATVNGISKLRTPFTEPKPNFKTLIGGPNPFRIGGGDMSEFTIHNLVGNSAVRVYTEDGRLVKEIAATEIAGSGQVKWDGQDDKGKLVPSGVYFYIAYVEQSGESAVGKVAVIHR